MLKLNPLSYFGIFWILLAISQMIMFDFNFETISTLPQAVLAIQSISVLHLGIALMFIGSEFKSLHTKLDELQI